LENELFGHERGAFTGADRTTLGRLEAAAGGTVFLDEISNLPVGLQSKLLRALETKELFRVGSSTARKVDVRVVAAANRSLGSLVAAGDFREDLFHRLCEYEIQVPALRERREDILFLAQRFLDSANEEYGSKMRGFSQSAIDALLNYDWPGNVRELRNVVRRAALLADELVECAHLRLRAMPATGAAGPRRSVWQAGSPQPLKEIVRRAQRQLEQEVLSEVLGQTGGNRALAARLLGIDYKTILTKIRRYGIEGKRAPQRAENPEPGP
jgi:two-component system nitrogen regulation response regulator GlnG